MICDRCSSARRLGITHRIMNRITSANHSFPMESLGGGHVTFLNCCTCKPYAMYTMDLYMDISDELLLLVILMILMILHINFA